MHKDSQESLISPVKSDMSRTEKRLMANVKRKLTIKDRELHALKEKFGSERDAILRQIADLENLLRAKEREFQARLKSADRQLITDLLPFIDTLDAGSKENGHPELVMPIKSMILNILRKHGLEEVKTEGSRFDPYRHEVVGVTEDGDDGIVQEEVQKGYTINNEVIRTAKVIVSKR